MEMARVSRSLTPADQWARVQRSLAALTGLSFTTLTKSDKVIAEAGDLSLCRLMSEAGNGGPRCSLTCLSEAGLARRENAIRFFRCRAGLACFAAPVAVKGHPVATILGGRVLEKAPDSSFFQGLAREHGLPEEEVLRAVGKLPLENSRNLSRTAALVGEIAEVLFQGFHQQGMSHRRLALLKSLFQLGSDLSPDKDPLEIHALIINTVSILFDVEGAALFLHHPKSGRFRVRTAFGTAERHCLNLELDGGMDIVGEVLERRETVVSDDYHRLLGSGLPEQIRSAALFPLLFGEEVRGLLMIINTQLSPESVQLIFSFCGQASTAIQNTLLRQELKVRMEEAERLARIQGRIVSALDLDDLLKAIFEEAAAMTRAEQASLMVLDRRTRELIVKLARGMHSPVIQKVSLGLGEGLAGQVARSGRPLLVPDIEQDPRFGRRRRQRYRSNSFLVFPVAVNHRVIGVINLTDKEGGAFGEEDLEILSSLQANAAVALQRSELYQMTQELQKVSMTDHLTQLLNRRSFQLRSEEEIMRAQRHNMPMSLVMLDVDDFKGYNDRLGHLAGDDLLVGVARLMRQTVRTIDVVSRFGGEEFAILSPQTRGREALSVAERIREAVRRHPFTLGQRRIQGSVSVSGGVASFPDQATNLQELIDNADRALYRAKRAGKNRVVLFSPA